MVNSRIYNKLMELRGVSMNICASEQHVQIERYIETVKKRVYAVPTILPFERYPPHSIVKTVYSG